MIDELQAELERQQWAARTAYIRFMTAGELLRRRGLSASEANKAKNIHMDAFGALTVSLASVFGICDVLHPTNAQEPERHRAPRYSADIRRQIL